MNVRYLKVHYYDEETDEELTEPSTFSLSCSQDTSDEQIIADLDSARKTRFHDKHRGIWVKAVHKLVPPDSAEHARLRAKEHGAAGSA